MDKKDFVSGVSSYMERLCREGRYTTAKSYRDALNSFKHFSGLESIPYVHINKEVLHRYQSWLLGRRCSRNTVSTYMRRIRHIYNLAVDTGDAPYVPNLFKEVFTGVESRRKRAVSEESLSRLLSTRVSDPDLRKVQVALCLMFLFCGMAFVDLAHLRREDIYRIIAVKAVPLSKWNCPKWHCYCWKSCRLALRVVLLTFFLSLVVWKRGRLPIRSTMPPYSVSTGTWGYWQSPAGYPIGLPPIR